VVGNDLGAIPGPWPYVLSKNQIVVSDGGRESAELVLATTQRKLRTRILLVQGHPQAKSAERRVAATECQPR
jgi:23S rRNA C2498 (ribose-2'-O)-methylase RlmM